MASNVEYKSCPRCGARLVASLVDAINNPSSPESCPRFSEVKNPIVLAIENTKAAINAGYRGSITIDTDTLSEPDELAIVAMQQFAMDYESAQA